MLDREKIINVFRFVYFCLLVFLFLTTFFLYLQFVFLAEAGLTQKNELQNKLNNQATGQKTNDMDFLCSKDNTKRLLKK